MSKNIFNDILLLVINMTLTLKIIFAVIGSVIFLNGVGLTFTSNSNVGILMTLFLGAVIIVTALFFEKMLPWLKVLLVSGIGIAVICCSFLIIYGKTDNVTYKEDAVIVLGAAVHGKTPSLTLKRRLETAVKYYNQNPEVIIVVSGGKGPQEDITEAEAMKQYLVEKGVAQDNIIKEESATSTYENFVFSKLILDEKFKNDYSVAFITNEYHILRAGACANRAGIKNLTHIHSDTSLSYIIAGSLRECLAVVKYLVFKK